MKQNLKTDLSPVNVKFPEQYNPDTNAKENPGKKNAESTEQDGNMVVNEQEQDQVVNSEDQEEFIDATNINTKVADKSNPGETKITNLQNAQPISFGNDEDDDDDDDEPLREIEIGDDPDETKKKIPVM